MSFLAFYSPLCSISQVINTFIKYGSIFHEIIIKLLHTALMDILMYRADIFNPRFFFNIS